MSLPNKIDKNALPTISFDDDKPFKIIEKVSQLKQIHIYLSEGIGPPQEYIDLISTIRTASPHDQIFIHLNNSGGYVDTGTQIINAMRDSEAQIVTILDGTVCSMSSLIFLAAGEFLVHDNSRLMFHNYSGGTYGKGHEQITQLESTSEWFTTMFHDICYPFLSIEEIEAVIAGQDIWMNSGEIKQRLGDMVKFIEEEQKALAEEEERKNAKKRRKHLEAELKKLDKLEQKQ